MTTQLPTSAILETELGPVEVADSGGDGLAVLSMHGTPGGYEQSVVMSTFLAAAGFRVIALSRPGYGRTPLSGQTATIDGQADLCAAVLDELGIGSAAIFGWSGGGPASYRFAVLHPDRCIALITFGAVCRSYVWDEPLAEKLMFGTGIGMWLVKRLAEKSPERAILGTINSTGDIDEETAQRLAAVILADPVKLNFVLTLLSSAHQGGDHKIGTKVDLELFEAIEDLELSKISVPSVIVHGRVDNQLPCAESEWAAAEIPGAELLVLAGGSHIALFTDPGCELPQQRIVDAIHLASAGRI
jgi:pimeloyl-ACP methyl ester carboxylesterase